jgi:hypothetical protein
VWWCLAREEDLLCWSPSEFCLCCQPGINAMLESASGTVIGDGLAIWKAKLVLYDHRPLCVYIFLCGLAFMEVVTEQCAEGTSVGPDA